MFVPDIREHYTLPEFAGQVIDSFTIAEDFGLSSATDHRMSQKRQFLSRAVRVDSTKPLRLKAL
jgi:hypothetical protein